MRKILAKILKILATLTLKRYKPKIIAITGSVGKTSTREAVYFALNSKYKVRRSKKSFNNEIGVPLTILNINAFGKNIFLWLFAFIKAGLNLIWTKYPEILILEYGVDKPNDMDYLLSIAIPDIAIVTAIGDIPAHVENFSSPTELIKEKTKLVKAVSKDGIVILNSDYEATRSMRKKTNANVVLYGFSKDSDILIYKPENLNVVDGGFVGTSFKIEHEGSIVPFRIYEYGTPNVYAVSASCAVGICLGMNLVDLSEALLKYKAPEGRFNVIKGIKNITILDDSYNASPSSMKASLETFKTFNAKRKISVLGNMLEIGKYSEEAHREVGKMASKISDIIITVGDKAKFIADEAKKSGFVEGKNLFSFDSSEALSKNILNMIKEEDVILFKASRGIKLERAIDKIII